MKQFRLVLFLFSAAWLTGCSATPGDPGVAHPDPPAPATDSISGTVTYRGAPLAGVTVTLWMTNTNAVTGTAITDSNGAYSFSGIKTTGNVPSDYHLWAAKPGYGFLPSVSSGAKVIRSDHTGQFEPGVTGTTTFGVPMYLTVIDYIALPDASLTGGKFSCLRWRDAAGDSCRERPNCELCGRR